MFPRLSEKTQEWIRLFVELLRIAETMDTYTEVPPNFSRVVRNNMTYTVKTFDGMQYMVATRPAVIRELGVVNP